MLGMKSREVSRQEEGSVDVAKVFFDTFSKRVTAVEDTIRQVSSELAKVKSSTDRSQISDLVLLDRIQRTEGLLEESLNWTKRLIELMLTTRASRPVNSQVAAPSDVGGYVAVQSVPSVMLRPIVSPSGEAGSLSSITTPTELQVLTLLAEQGAVSAPEIGRLVGRSREHTARLMKRLFQEGYVKRDQNRIPFRYSLAERVRQSFSKPAQEAEQKVSTEEGKKEEAAVAPPEA